MNNFNQGFVEELNKIALEEPLKSKVLRDTLRGLVIAPVALLLTRLSEERIIKPAMIKKMKKITNSYAANAANPWTQHGV